MNSHPSRSLPNISLFLFSSVALASAVFLTSVHSLALLPGVTSHYDNKRTLELILIGLGLLVIVFFPQLIESVLSHSKRKNTLLVLSGIVCLGLASALLAQSPRHALLEFSLLAGLALFSLLATRFWQRYQIQGLLIYVATLAISACIYMTGFYAGYLAAFLEDIPLRWPEPFYGFSSVRFFNQYQIWTFALFSLPMLLLPTLRPVLRRSMHMLLICWWVLLFASGSRGAIIAILLAYVATAIIYRQFALPLIWHQLLTLMFGLALYAVLFQVLPLFLAPDTDIASVNRWSGSGRLALWLTAVEVIQQNPLLGIGPMHYASLPNVTNNHPHSSLLQWASEWGIPSTLLLLGLVGSSLHSWIQRFNARTLKTESISPEIPPAIPVVLFCTLIGGMSYSLVSGVIVTPMSQILMVIVVGLMLGVYCQNQTKFLAHKIDRIAYRLVAGSILILLSWSVLPEFTPRLMDQTQFLSNQSTSVGPRLWLSGGIPRHQ